MEERLALCAKDRDLGSSAAPRALCSSVAKGLGFRVFFGLGFSFFWSGV